MAGFANCIIYSPNSLWGEKSRYTRFNSIYIYIFQELFYPYIQYVFLNFCCCSGRPIDEYEFTCNPGDSEMDEEVIASATIVLASL